MITSNTRRNCQVHSTDSTDAGGDPMHKKEPHLRAAQTSNTAISTGGK